MTYTWSVFGNIISVTAPDGRKKRTHLGVFRRTTAFAASLVLSLVVVIGEQHLRHILMCYMEYYNAVRTHLSLEGAEVAAFAEHNQPDDEQREHRSLSHATRRGSSPLIETPSGWQPCPPIFLDGNT